MPATVHAPNQVRPSAAWPPPDQERLIAAYRAGGKHACVLAFPDRTRGAVYSAVRRFCWDGPGFDSTVPFARTRADVRAAIVAMPFDRFIDAIGELIPRRADFRGAR